MRAKLIREIPQPEGLPYYFRRYEFECIDCGRIYHNGHCNERTIPYCGECQRKHSYERAKERAKEKEQAKIDAVLEDIKADMRELKTDHRHNYKRNSFEERAWQQGIEDCIDILYMHISRKDR